MASTQHRPPAVERFLVKLEELYERAPEDVYALEILLDERLRKARTVAGKPRPIAAKTPRE